MSLDLLDITLDLVKKDFEAQLLDLKITSFRSTHFSVSIRLREVIFCPLLTSRQEQGKGLVLDLRPELNQT